ncbi:MULTISPECIES: Ail/Lom family outer membrane beta-barrel protein [Edwardsiella]|uniref:Attachment invasion locus protein n=2 Tax=Edwardsiella anguillarum TaxID=1821960 RepID=A0A076LKK8_9GAMM|nr:MULTISPECIES: Ail/Lom family outer membrane beta-barrel protein [Edwardsiella]AKM47132.1 virulence protein [Edwardsiella sp. EA181011]GAJ67429.1 attachment invasion locus protein [Edwardsiella piscicida]AIJ07248.1 Attachment invasion locus protein precursor [Edwardsiella anguillarum ET080813]AKR78586.1 Ail/Lom family outer membrane beta-barrel protein [Edwardsiella sp. LADL05-105]KAB0590906.1 outer membrane beta-barrel protein [Edwardsiella anguillarum]
MKKSFCAVSLLISLGAAAPAMAEGQTVSLGYAQAKVADFKNITGVNLKYRYEWDSPLSLMTSFTYMGGSKAFNESAGPEYYRGNGDLKYYSLAAGPAWRINDSVSVYGLLGVNVNKTAVSAAWRDVWVGGYEEGSLQQTRTKGSLMYGAGLQINPLANWSIDVGYEGSRVDLGGSKHSINGFNLGVGYRF